MKKVWLQKNGKEIGPLTISELSRLEIKGTDKVWWTGKSEWDEIQKTDLWEKYVVNRKAYIVREEKRIEKERKKNKRFKIGVIIFFSVLVLVIIWRISYSFYEANEKEKHQKWIADENKKFEKFKVKYLNQVFYTKNDNTVIKSSRYGRTIDTINGLEKGSVKDFVDRDTVFVQISYDKNKTGWVKLSEISTIQDTTSFFKLESLFKKKEKGKIEHIIKSIQNEEFGYIGEHEWIMTISDSRKNWLENKLIGFVDFQSELLLMNISGQHQTFKLDTILDPEGWYSFYFSNNDFSVEAMCFNPIRRTKLGFYDDSEEIDFHITLKNNEGVKQDEIYFAFGIKN